MNKDIILMLKTSYQILLQERDRLNNELNRQSRLITNLQSENMYLRTKIKQKEGENNDNS